MGRCMDGMGGCMGGTGSKGGMGGFGGMPQLHMWSMQLCARVCAAVLPTRYHNQCERFRLHCWPMGQGPALAMAANRLPGCPCAAFRQPACTS
jgi:hypothetical protein